MFMESTGTWAFVAAGKSAVPARQPLCAEVGAHQYPIDLDFLVSDFYRVGWQWKGL